MRQAQTILAGTVAGFALVAGAALAQPGNGNGKGNNGGNGGGPPAAQERGNGGGNGGGGPGNKGGNKGGGPAKAQNRGGGPDRGAGNGKGGGNGPGNGSAKGPGGAPQHARADKGPQDKGRGAPGNGNGNGKGSAVAKGPGNGPARGNGNGNGNGKGGGNGKAPPMAGAPGNGNSNARLRGNAHPSNVVHRPERGDIRRVSYSGPGGRDFIVPTNERVRVLTRDRTIDWGRIDRRRVYDGCPPGLAKKYNGCTPPGLDRGPRYSWSRPDWYWSGFNRGGNYRYLDGYMVRTGSGSSILDYIPLLAGALAIGNVWPGSYDSVAMPDYYNSYYGLGGGNSYRYYDDTLYRVNPGSSRIDSIAGLLMGSDIAVGQPMPRGYDVYNVPYGYRDQYYDTPDALYRYSDGYIYQLDPTSRLVQAAIELLV